MEQQVRRAGEPWPGGGATGRVGPSGHTEQQIWAATGERAAAMEEQLRASSLRPCEEGARAQETQEWTPHVNDSTHFQIFFQPNVKLEWTKPFQPNKRWLQPNPQNWDRFNPSHIVPKPNTR